MATLLAINAVTGRPTKLQANDPFTTTGAVGTGALTIGGAGVAASQFSSGDVGGNSGTVIPTQSAVKTYVDAQIHFEIDGLDNYGAQTLHQTQDHFAVSDNGAEKKISWSDLQDSLFADITGDVTFAAGGASTIVSNSVALGTDTTGNYVGTITGGTGITSSAATTGEGTTHSLSVDAAQTQITSVGTIATGVWEATDVGIAHGGTGASTAPAALAALCAGAQTGNALTIATSADTITIAGNLTVSGATTTVNTATLSVEDPLIALASANGADAVDVGFYAKYVDSGTKYAGLFRDASDADTWKLFKTTGNSDEAPTTTVNTSSGFALADLDVGVLTATSVAGALTTASQTAITGVGTIGTGVWQGTAINQTYLTGQSGTNTGDETQASIDGLAITVTGALGSGSIATGFGNIDNGSNTITTSGLVTAGSLTCNGARSFANSASVGWTNTTASATLPYTYWWDSQTVRPLVTAENVRLGDICCIDTAGKAALADKAQLAEVDAIIGFAGATIGSGVSCPIQCAEGILVVVEGWDGSNGVNEDWNGDKGKMVFLGAAGKPTKISPASTGDAVFQVGVIIDGGANAAAAKTICTMKRMIFVN